jgi:hypothetical protein
MEQLPLYISVFFVLTTLLTVYLFVRAAHFSRVTIVVIVLWLVIQAVIALTGFYTKTDVLPPRFLIVVLPPFLFILGLFFTRKGKQFIDSLSLSALTLLHTVRIPVEIVLFWLFLNKAIPRLMTFDGRNFDIVSGVTAPLMYYFVFVKKQWNSTTLLLWNFICLGLLINIVINAILSAPFPFQQFAFDQPNKAILYFPFVWLPCCIVPLVLLAHLAAIRKLLQE